MRLPLESSLAMTTSSRTLLTRSRLFALTNGIGEFERKLPSLHIQPLTTDITPTAVTTPVKRRRTLYRSSVVVNSGLPSPGSTMRTVTAL